MPHSRSAFPTRLWEWFAGRTGENGAPEHSRVFESTTHRSRCTSYEGANVVDVALEVAHWIPFLIVLPAHYTLTMSNTCRKRNTQQIAAKRKEDGCGTPCPLRYHGVQSRVIGSECRVPILRCGTEPCHTPRSRGTSSPRSEGRYSPCLLPLEKRILIIVKGEAIQTVLVFLPSLPSTLLHPSSHSCDSSFPQNNRLCVEYHALFHKSDSPRSFRRDHFILPASPNMAEKRENEIK